MALPAILGAAAGLGSMGAGIFQGLAQQNQAKQLQQGVWSGMGAGQALAASQFAQIKNAPEYAAGQAFIRSIYGIDPNAQGTKASLLGEGWTNQAGRLELGTKSTYGFTGKSWDPFWKQLREETGTKGNVAYTQTKELAGRLADISKIQRLKDAGVDLSAEQQAMLEGDETKGLYGQLSGMGENQKALLARFLSQRGVNQETWASTFGTLRGAAGVEAPAAAGGGYDFSKALQTNPLVQNFQKGLQSAQAGRGLYGSNVSAAAEAGGMASTLFNLQQQFLPALMGLPTQQSDLLYKLQQQAYGPSVYGATGGQAVYGQPIQPGPSTAEVLSGAVGSGLQGAIGGYLLGSQLGGAPAAGGGPAGVAYQYTNPYVSGPTGVPTAQSFYAR